MGGEKMASLKDDESEREGEKKESAKGRGYEERRGRSVRLTE